MTPQELLQTWGFMDHPFEDFTAERTVEITELFVKPPFFSDICGRSGATQSAIVFGYRGEGKSTLCEMVRQSLDDRTPDAPLIINYIEYPGWSESDLRSISLEDHIAHIAWLSIDTLLSRFERDFDLFDRLNDQQKNLFWWYVLRFSRLDDYAENERRYLELYYRSRGCADWRQKSAKGLRKFWGYLRRRRVEIEAASSTGGKLNEIVRIVIGIFGPRVPGRGEFRNDGALSSLRRLASLAKAAGMPCLYILVDKVDENDVCSRYPDLVARFVGPLVRSVEFLECDGVATKLFLPGNVRSTLGSALRVDRIRTREIAWSEPLLRRLLERRLKVYSENRVDSLRPFVEPSVWEKFDQKLFMYTAGCPRNLIRILDLVMSTLCEIEDRPNLITEEALNLGVRRFFTIRITEEDADEYQKRIRVQAGGGSAGPP